VYTLRWNDVRGGSRAAAGLFVEAHELQKSTNAYTHPSASAQGNAAGWTRAPQSGRTHAAALAQYGPRLHSTARAPVWLIWDGGTTGQAAGSFPATVGTEGR